MPGSPTDRGPVTGAAARAPVPVSGAAWLAAPLLAFLMIAFILPIASLLLRGVEDRAVAPALPRTLPALRAWSGQGMPDAAACASLARDLAAARAAGTLAAAAARLNDDVAGMRSVLFGTARRLGEADHPVSCDELRAADPAWGRTESWGAIRRAAGPWTGYHLLTALDLRRDDAGNIRPVPADRAVFRAVFARTFWMAGLATALCLLLGYPVAALLARRDGRRERLLLLAVLLPFWTSLIVRTAAWMVLLARAGPLNEALVALGLFGAPRQLLYNRFAVIVAMVHILLPYMILPLHAVMRQIPPVHMRAAASLGAAPLRAFRAVWLPLTLPGIGAGTVLVFVQALGFYVTPALLGGGADQMLPWFIGFYANQTVNWGLAAALSLLLLLAVAALAAGSLRLGRPYLSRLAP